MDSTDTSADTASESWRSTLYPDDWTPGFSVEDEVLGTAFLQDFSYAGYRNGEVVPPELDELGELGRFDVTEEGADPSGESDSCPAIQASIDAAGEAGGGVVWLPEGLYRCDGLLQVGASGVVLVGEGPERSRLYFTRGGAEMSDVHHLSFVGSVAEGEDLLLTEDGDVFEQTVVIDEDQAASLQPGDEVAVGWVVSEEFVDEHEMTGTWQVSNGEWRPFFRRRVVDVDGGRVHLDVPLRYPALTRDSASLRVETGHLREVGVQDLGLSTTVSWEDAWSADRSHALGMSGVRDGWVRRVESFESPAGLDDRGRHLQSGGVFVVHSARVSVLDSRMAHAQNRGEGGNGYLFEVSRSGEVLFADCSAEAGRHNFIQNWDFGTSGVVWLRTRSSGGRAYTDSSEGFATTGTSEFHHQLAMANLIDQSWTDDGWAAVNRWAWSSGAGHTATESVFWNLSGPGTLTSLQAGRGYVVGTTDVVVDTEFTGAGYSTGTQPEDWSEGVGEGATLAPESLYEDQLARRLAGGGGLW